MTEIRMTKRNASARKRFELRSLGGDRIYNWVCRFYGLSMAKRYTVSDGKLVLTVEEAEEGGFIITSPLDPELITEAESISGAFVNARDALKALRQSRAKLLPAR